MATLHVLGDWHGPGEEKAARRLAESLPGHWDVVAGRNVPSGMGTVDLDLVVVGERAVFVCEEKAWGPHVITGEVSWYVKGAPRHNPVGQVNHAARVLAGRSRKKMQGWSQARLRPPGVPLASHQPADDVYSLALRLVQWLHGDASDLPDHDVAGHRAAAYPEVGQVLARGLSSDTGERLSAAEAVDGLRPPDPVPGQELFEGAVLASRFRLVRRLGEGAWATTWLAYDENPDKHRTLKFLRPDRVSAEQAKVEFEILRSHHCARMDDRLPNPEPGVLVQEYLPGQTLHDFVAGNRPLELTIQRSVGGRIRAFRAEGGERVQTDCSCLGSLVLMPRLLPARLAAK